MALSSPAPKYTTPDPRGVLASLMRGPYHHPVVAALGKATKRGCLGSQLHLQMQQRGAADQPQLRVLLFTLRPREGDALCPQNKAEPGHCENSSIGATTVPWQWLCPGEPPG